MKAKRNGANSLPGTNSANDNDKNKDKHNILYLIYCYCKIRIGGYSHYIALWAIGKAVR